jgi:hypothetical protein
MGLHKEKMMESNEIEEYYEFIIDPLRGDELYGAIEIIKGDFGGLVYNYKEYNFTKIDEETGAPTVKFSFDVLSVPDDMLGKQYPDEKKQEFDQLLGDILIDIVTNQIDEEGRKVYYDNADREGDIDESFEGRELHENDTPLPTE